MNQSATSDADPNNIVVNYEGRPPDVDNLNTDVSHIGNDLEEVIKKSTSFVTADQQLSEQAPVVGSPRSKTKDLSPICSLNLPRILRYTYGSKKMGSGVHKMIKKISPFDVPIPALHLKIFCCANMSLIVLVRDHAVSEVSFSAKVDVVNRK